MLGDLMKLSLATSLSESTMNLLLKIAWIEPKKKAKSQDGDKDISSLGG